MAIHVSERAHGSVLYEVVPLREVGQHFTVPWLTREFVIYRVDQSRLQVPIHSCDDVASYPQIMLFACPFSWRSKCSRNVPKSNIETTFVRAMTTPDEGLRLKELDELPGIGPAMVSVILTFYDPSKYGVLDIHVWRELFGPEPSGLFQGSRCLMLFLQDLRSIAARHSMRARTVEKALFQKNYDESRRVN